MRKIDIATWPRREHFEFFSRMDYPQYNICFNLDITGFLKYIKAAGLPFYYTMIYLSTLSADAVDEFRYRIHEDAIVIHDSLTPSFTDMDKNSDLFKMVTVEINGNLRNFNAAAKEISSQQSRYFIAEDFIGRSDFIYFTSIPWISFTHLSHTINLNRNDAVPRISWGKYYEESGKIFLPYSVQVHHAFVDGIHVGRYKQILEMNMSRIAEL